MNYYKTLIYAVWFVKVNGYIPTSSELATFIPIAKNIGIQSVAYGLARTGFDGTLNPAAFIPLTSIVPASIEFILGQPTYQEKAIAMALVSAGTTTIGSMIQISGPNGTQINLAAGTFLYAIAQFLAEHNNTAFVNISYSPNVTRLQLQGATYYIIVFYILIMAGLSVKLCVTIVKYIITKIEYKKYQKSQQLKVIRYLKNQIKHEQFKQYCKELLNQNNSI